MKDSYRRSYKKIIGSTLRSNSRVVNRRSLLKSIGESIDPSISIILREVLDIQEEGWESLKIGAYSTGRAEITKQLDGLRADISTRFEEFFYKWDLRLQNESIEEILVRGNWVVQDGTFWRLGVKNNKKEMKELFYQMAHILVGDAEKLLVMAQSRCSQMQESVIKKWYQEIDSPESRLLPTLEASLRPWESEVMRRVRNRMYPLALEYFQNGIRAGSKETFTSIDELVSSFGRYWDPLEISENGMLAFLQTFTELANGLADHIINWYIQKMGLYLRGFRRGQLDLFQNKEGS